MTISSAVQEAIAKELPSVVASELKTYLEQAEKDKESLAAVNIKLLNANTRIIELNTKVSDLELLKLERAELDKRTLELDAKDRGMELKFAQLQVYEANRRADAIYNLVDRVFKNPVATRTVVGNIPVATPGGPQGGGYVSTHPSNETITDTTE